MTTKMTEKHIEAMTQAHQALAEAQKKLHEAQLWELEAETRHIAAELIGKQLSAYRCVRMGAKK